MKYRRLARRLAKAKLEVARTQAAVAYWVGGPIGEIPTSYLRDAADATGEVAALEAQIAALPPVMRDQSQ